MQPFLYQFISSWTTLLWKVALSNTFLAGSNSFTDRMPLALSMFEAFLKSEVSKIYIFKAMNTLFSKDAFNWYKVSVKYI